MITAKEEFVGGEKYRRALKLCGGDAIAMWLALKRYAAEHPSTAGFVPDENIDDLPGAPRRPRKALEALLNCGRLLRDGTRGAGLVESTAGGWQLHDYLDHANAPEDEELRREKERVRKQHQRAEKRRELDRLREQAGVPLLVEGDGFVPPVSQGQAGHVPGQAGPVPGVVPGTALACARAPAPARTCARTRVGARSQPNPTQPNPSLSLPEEREIDSNEPRPEPERTPATAPRIERRWRCFPKGWCDWSLETLKEAVAQGLNKEDLARHVDYWSLRDFPGGAVNDLDGELFRSIPGIAERKRKAAAAGKAGAAPAAPDPHAWAPLEEHRAFAKKRDLPLQDAIVAYRASGIPDKLGTFRAHEDFSRRLRWWAEHGGDFPTGKPRRRDDALPEQRKAVGA